MTLQLSWRWSSSGLCILTLLSPKTKARGHCALWDTSICAQVPRTCAAKMWLMPQRFDRITLHKSRASKIEVRASPIILGHYVTHKLSHCDPFPLVIYTYTLCFDLFCPAWDPPTDPRHYTPWKGDQVAPPLLPLRPSTQLCKQGGIPSRQGNMLRASIIVVCGYVVVMKSRQ